MKNNFGWMQLETSDPQMAKSFYGKLFDWSLTDKMMTPGNGPYTEIDAGNGPCAGIAQGERKDESHWIPFVNVADIHEHTKKAESLGAKIVVPITALGGDEGFYCVFVDPTGAVLGLWGPK